MNEIFIMTHEYSDNSGFNVCGITRSYEVAKTWFIAQHGNNVYQLEEGQEVRDPHQGITGWKQP